MLPALHKSEWSSVHNNDPGMDLLRMSQYSILFKFGSSSVAGSKSINCKALLRWL